MRDGGHTHGKSKKREPRPAGRHKDDEPTESLTMRISPNLQKKLKDWEDDTWMTRSYLSRLMMEAAMVVLEKEKNYPTKDPENKPLQEILRNFDIERARSRAENEQRGLDLAGYSARAREKVMEILDADLAQRPLAGV